MTLHIDLAEFALRLLSAFATSLVLGLDRELHERAAGMRTTILVGLAACFAMMSANLILPMGGKQADSYVQMDVMRLPLGILTGMGFIGAGAIMRRSDGFVLGVTTAATLWFVTVMGLCFGAGQYGLGGSAFVSGIVTLWLLKHVERHIQHDRDARLTLILSRDGPSEDDVRAVLTLKPFRIRRSFVRIEPATGRRELRFELRYAGPQGAGLPERIEGLAKQPGIEQLDWEF